MTWKDLSAERFNSMSAKVVIDVRAPCEFEKESIPGAVNIPLLSDKEREIVGTVYKEEGEFKARKLALEIVSPKIPEIVERTVQEKQENHTLVVHCWRGGMRSEAIVSFLSLMGVDCWRLAGGYKAWRRCLLDDFQSDKFDFRAVVVDGLTGVGKTDVLMELEKLGYQVLNLEAIANHRGSVFGGLGLGSQPTQKNFDAHLWLKLREFEEQIVFLEAESRNIGSITLPEFLVEKIDTGTRVLLEAGMHSRIERIEKEYRPDKNRKIFSQLIKSTKSIKERIGGEKFALLSDLLEEEKSDYFIEIMLKDYYDPLYMRHIGARNYALKVAADSPAQAATSIVEWCTSSSTKIA